MSEPQPPPINANGEYVDDPEGEEDFDEEDILEWNAKQLLSVLIPVSLTMCLTIFYTRSLIGTGTGNSNDAAFIVSNETDTQSTSQKLGGALLNALVFIAMIGGVTVVFVILYKYRCMKVSFILVFSFYVD
eukprot:TRINITY_DN3215_c0_g1_i2.p1 TRINITY_DN3215_c0_g1~~TRINITY_DN3215_c0_g1_i2.p1  ORF type:complete len:141 (-),score=39.90 TRINITY_DN3215_c0_g1_i2:801-1193(-)